MFIVLILIKSSVISQKGKSQNGGNKKTKNAKFRGESRAAATSKMERFVIIVNGFQPLTIITKRSILDVAAVLDPPLKFSEKRTFLTS